MKQMRFALALDISKCFLKGDLIMYPHEMLAMIESKNHELNREELLQVINVNVNTHLTHVKYSPFGDRYEMWDRYGNYYYFRFKGEKE